MLYNESESFLLKKNKFKVMVMFEMFSSYHNGKKNIEFNFDLCENVVFVEKINITFLLVL